MGLYAMDAAVCEMLPVEIDFQAFDSTLDAGTHAIPGAVPGRMLGMIPVDLWKVTAMDSDVSALALFEAASR